ncbi:MAG: DNA-protecting protein DprA, partial [Caulobacteraceae bacterium]|nr:DNA-protecting protein DprA [Caulobacteraceae bacterium]
MDEAERLSWLRLARTEQVGPVTFAQLMGRFGSASAALAALPDLARRGGRAGDLRIPSAAAARAELDAGAQLGARMLCSQDDDFPQRLAAIDPPPPLIWVLGDIRLASRPTAALVGARIASAAGQRFARGLAAQLGEAGVVVVSGMARGIDAAAHEGALPTGTIAVLGGGVLNVYPPEHDDLATEVAASGAVVGEQPPLIPPFRGAFPQRNRIVSGLALGTIVVQAGDTSGALITARLAGEQGREVFAVPGQVDCRLSRGCHRLIRDGAKLVEHVDDVLEELGPLFEATTSADGRQVRAPAELRLDDVERAVLD